MGIGQPDLLLVVDDSDAMRDLLEHQLAERGYEVVTAADGERALALVAERRPDAILLDHELPGLSGLEVLARLRADDGLAAVPVIMLTTRARAVAAAHLAARRRARPPAQAVRPRRARGARGRRAAGEEAQRRARRREPAARRAGAHRPPHGPREPPPRRARARPRRRARRAPRPRRWRSRGSTSTTSRRSTTTHGHQGGDEVLAEVARRLAEAVRGGDELARWGGDEFVVIQPATDRAGAGRAAERLRAAVAGGADRRPRRSRSPSAGRTGRATRPTTCSRAPTARSTAPRTRAATPSSRSSGLARRAAAPIGEPRPARRRDTVRAMRPLRCLALLVALLLAPAAAHAAPGDPPIAGAHPARRRDLRADRGRRSRSPTPARSTTPSTR